MIFKRINRTGPEQIFVVFKANEANIAADDVVCLETTAASVDGVAIIQPATAYQAQNLIVGVADAAIASGAYGLVQVYGYRSTSRINLTDSTQTSLGVGLSAVSGQDYFMTVASEAGEYPQAVLLESVTTSNVTTSKKVFLRFL